MTRVHVNRVDLEYMELVSGVAVVFHGSRPKRRGTLAGSAAAGTLAGGSGTSFIGRLGSGWYPFQGTLDELAVFPAALSAERVRTHYLGGAALRVVVTPTQPTTLHTTASAAASELDPDTTTNTLTLTSTVNP